jgi:hypothetical protein
MSSIHDNLNITFVDCYSTLCLDKDEWHTMIDKFITNIQSKPLGKKLWQRLMYHLDSGKKLWITTKDDYNRIIFPKTRYINSTNVLIVIPNINYFGNIETIDRSLFDGIDTSELKGNDRFNFEKLCLISEWKSASCALKDSEVDELRGLVSYAPQTYFITFVHELIHCVRFFEGINLTTTDEEDATIYGIKHKTLVIEGSEITENTIRKEWDKPPRISHASTSEFVADLSRTNVNRDKFSKASFMVL